MVKQQEKNDLLLKTTTESNCKSYAVTSILMCLTNRINKIIYSSIRSMSPYECSEMS